IDDGRQAINCASRLEPDLIMIEFRLPFIDGIETARSILSRKPIPIVLITAYAAADFVRRAREAGVVAHLVTPVEPRQLTSIIEAAVARCGRLETRHAG